MSVKSKTISVIESASWGLIPAFVRLAHRSFEKSLPKPIREDEKYATYRIPTDVLSVIHLPPRLVEAISELEITYRKQKKAQLDSTGNQGAA